MLRMHRHLHHPLLVLGVFRLLVLALIVAGIVLAVRALRRRGPDALSARAILDRRLASGAISEEEYRHRRSLIEQPATTEPS
jgi:uncharacterized membrane protein